MYVPYDGSLINSPQKIDGDFHRVTFCYKIWTLNEWNKGN